MIIYKGHKIFKDAFNQIRFYSIRAKELDNSIDYNFADSISEAKARIDLETKKAGV